MATCTVIFERSIPTHRGRDAVGLRLSLARDEEVQGTIDIVVTGSQLRGITQELGGAHLRNRVLQATALWGANRIVASYVPLGAPDVDGVPELRIQEGAVRALLAGDDPLPTLTEGAALCSFDCA